MAQPATPAGDDLDADRAEQASGYAGPPAQPQLTPAIERNAKIGRILSGVGSVLQSFGHHLIATAADDAREQVEQAYSRGHRHGWFERGEELGAAELDLEASSEQAPAD